MTKSQVIQIGILLTVLGLFSYKLTPLIGFIDVPVSSISNFILITIVIGWVLSYLYRVVNGKMTFMEQRKRYRKKYEKVINEKLISKFDSMSDEDQKRLLKELEEK